ncbi:MULTISPECIES: hypothetical protein [unclassified Crossiella]|uniref:hypothetical protein n=1 Tax=unclassified Crossiella TaxID=2620835 RepID=UPI001FFF0D91|nr:MULTISPECIES: hypothetical protein [unclassified Crossiella]MCK2240271.1 hypothetical protein [Crossiella sp. S99.2]MCK2253277.1 hypothetical protein [Crossiella sp. S99.1]
MLYLVLLLVLAAFGLLVTALVSGVTAWAWGSVVASVAAALLLFADWFLRRRRALAADPDPAADGEVGRPDAGEHTGAAGAAREKVVTGPEDDEDAGDATVKVASPAEPSTGLGASTGAPGEEDTDAADLLIVAALAAEVRVVDEHPRYHLAECTWLTGSATLRLPVREARELGFTPCGRCGPDRSLAAAHRAERAR